MVIHTGLMLVLLLAACTQEDDAGGEPVPTLEITTPASSGPGSYRWAVCRLESAYLDYSTVDEVEVSFGFRDPGRGTLRADHVWGVGEEHERRVQLANQQLANQGEQVVRRYVSRDQAAGAYRDDLSENSRERPASVDELRTRRGVLEAFGLTGASPVTNSDRRGATFERFESHPAPNLSLDQDIRLLPAATVMGHPVTNVVWVLDIWLDETDAVQRLRLMTKDVVRQVSELQFMPASRPWPDLTPPEELDCPADFTGNGSGWLGWEDYEQTLVVDLEVSLDPSGRPYELVVPENVRIRFEELTTLLVPDGNLRVMNGSSIEVDPAFFAEESTVVDLGSTVELEVSLIREVFEGWTAILGVRIQRPESEVARWGEFEIAYSTDGGVGGVTTMSVIERAGNEEDDEDGFNPVGREVMEGWDFEQTDVFAGDLDGIDGNDTIVFQNGYGDGTFPLARGYDSAGDLVAIMIWDTRYPWRLAVPDGDPPPDVTEREDQLVECIDGTREVLGDGTCRFDDD